jgi:hypothetical protein
MLSANNVVPTSVSTLVATDIADENGFTGTEQALQLRRFFPLELVHCIVILQRGVIKSFGSASPTKLSADGEATSIDSMFCGR